MIKIVKSGINYRFVCTLKNAKNQCTKTVVKNNISLLNYIKIVIV